MFLPFPKNNSSVKNQRQKITKQINQEAPDFERSLDFRPTKEVKQFTQQKQQPPQKLKTLLQQVNKRI
jgi:hypothetical protein